MQNLRILFLGILLLYTAMAAVNPEKVFVDRFLFNQKFTSWIFFQVYPSMYSTEIVFENLKEGKEFSVVHHPMRIFFENKLTNSGGEYKN